MRYHLAQLNIARMKAPLDSEQMRDFREGLDPINALSERSEGFVWRLKDEESGNAASIQAFDDPMIIVNLTVWEHLGALLDFAYKSQHADYVRRKSEWFERSDKSPYVLWWIPAGHIPTLHEAKKRLHHLHAHGETEHAFSFKKHFPTPSAAHAAVSANL